MKSIRQQQKTQQQTPTPHSQQTLQLLQLSSVDLLKKIQEELDLNPLLECAVNDEFEPLLQETINDDASDFQWSHLYTQSNLTKQFNQNDHSYDALYKTTVNLKEHLKWQLNLTHMTCLDHLIATTLIDALDDNGFLTSSLNDLYSPLISQITELNFSACECVRHRLQRFDPVGCFSLNLKETLLIQLNELPLSTPNLDTAKRVIHDHLNLLAQHKYQFLLKHFQLTERDLSKLITLILHLNPRPGSRIEQPSSGYITPDLIVKRLNKKWHVTLNSDTLPSLGINAHYALLMRQTQNQSDYHYLRNHLQEARCFLKTIQNRQETLLNVANAIVQSQTSFFEKGINAMKPLILKAMARRLNLNSSTLSRIITQNFIHTPRGLFELNYFFQRNSRTPSP